MLLDNGRLDNSRRLIQATTSATSRAARARDRRHHGDRDRRRQGRRPAASASRRPPARRSPRRGASTPRSSAASSCACATGWSTPRCARRLDALRRSLAPSALPPLEHRGTRLKLSPDEIASILKEQIDEATRSPASVAEVGTVIAGRRRYRARLRPRELRRDRDARVPARRDRPGAQPRRGQRRRRALRRVARRSSEGDTVKRTGQRHAACPVGDGARRPRRQPARQADRRRARHRDHRVAARWSSRRPASSSASR